MSSEEKDTRLPLKKRWTAQARSKHQQGHDQQQPPSRVDSESQPRQSAQRDRKVEAPTNPKLAAANPPSFYGKSLTASDVKYRHLNIPKNEVETRFPPLTMPTTATRGVTHKEEYVWLTVATHPKVDWEMKFTHSSSGGHRMSANWDDFVKKHKLAKSDVILFHEHLPPYHENHYLITFERANSAPDDTDDTEDDKAGSDGDEGVRELILVKRKNADKADRGGSNKDSGSDESYDPHKPSATGKKRKYYD